MKRPKNFASTLQKGHESVRKQRWADAYKHFALAHKSSSFSAADFEAYALAANLSGHESLGMELLTQAHQSFLDAGDDVRAARTAFWLGFVNLHLGELAKSSGWLSRASRLLQEHPDCVEHGYLLLPAALRAVREGGIAEAGKLFAEAVAIGIKFGDKDLTALALQGHGRTLIRSGSVERGVSLLDEAMIGVLAGEISSNVAGIIYCSVLDSCREMFDLQRAQEWTGALHRWCDAQPGLVPYRGHCQLQRAEILQLHGAWKQALQEALQAREHLSAASPRPPLGEACYRVAELHRIQGNFEAAEEFYKQSSRLSFTAQPGLALLRLAQGQTEAASALIKRLSSEVKNIKHRPELLEALVEIAIATGDLKSARAAAQELAQIASKGNIPFLQAMSLCASGAVCLAEGNPQDALSLLRQGWSFWTKLDAPYYAARARVLIASACSKQKDSEGAALELAGVCEVFEKLGATSDIARAQKLLEVAAQPSSSPLSVREREVLRLVASGDTNRGIANKLHISEKTVARHLSNIFDKLDLNSRAAATAYAYQNGLV